MNSESDGDSKVSIPWIPVQSNKVGRGRVMEAEDMIGSETDSISGSWGTLTITVVRSRERQRRGLGRNWLHCPRGPIIISKQKAVAACKYEPVHEDLRSTSLYKTCSKMLGLTLWNYQFLIALTHKKKKKNGNFMRFTLKQDYEPKINAKFFIVNSDLYLK